MDVEDSASLPPDENRGPEILAVCGTVVGLALAMVLLRIWVRVKMVRRLGGDDYFIIAAMTVMFVEMMIIIPQVHYGAGRHVQYIDPPSNVSKGLRLNFITQPLCLIALCLTKVSVGLFLLRFSPSRNFRRIIWAIMIFTVLSSIGNLLTVFFQCRPLAFTWDPTVPGGRCIPAANLKFAAFFNSSVSALTDLLFALLPIPMLWHVQLNWKVKAALAGILSLGIFATAAAIVKITFLDDYGKYGDFLFDSSDLTIWTTVEICTAIIAACIPCLKPLFRRILAGSSANSGSGGKKGSDGPNGIKLGRRFRDVEEEGLSAEGSATSGTHGSCRSRVEMGSEKSLAAKSPDTIRKTTKISVSVS